MVSNPNLSGFIAFFKRCDFDNCLLRILCMRFPFLFLILVFASCVKDDKCYDFVAGQTYEVPCDSQE